MALHHIARGPQGQALPEVPVTCHLGDSAFASFCVELFQRNLASIIANIIESYMLKIAREGFRGFILFNLIAAL